MKKIITSIFLSCLTAALFGQANTYFHDRIDTTLFAIADTVGHGANHYYATNLTPDFNVKQYVNGCTVNLFFKKGNTGSATLTLVTKTATLSSKTIRKANGQVLLSGDIPDSTAVILDYYNGSFRIAGIGVTASSSSWLLTGNSGTTAGTNFLGTTDAVDLVLKTNNTEKARISSAGILSLGLASTNNGSLLFRNSTNANTLTINSGVTSASHSWTLPTAQGAANTLLLNNGSGVLSWNTGGGLFWGLTGNAGTSSGTNFLGTTDSVDLVFKTNNLERMRLSRNFSAGGLGVGTNAPTARVHIKSSNTVIGDIAFEIDNSASAILWQQFSSGQIRVGDASGNIFMGQDAGISITSGYTNIGIGYHALRANQGGVDNTVLGAYAMESNVSGNENVAIGEEALRVNTGTENVAVGKKALFANVGGLYNTATGYGALIANTSGQFNTAYGIGAGQAMTTNSNGVFIGPYAGLYETASDKIYIGNGVTGVQVNETIGRLRLAIYGVQGTDSATTKVRINGELFLTSAINSSAGDAATINNQTGQFLKDGTGTTFTLTNSFIKSTSIILLTWASDPGAGAAHDISVVAGVGSAVITFGAAPSGNTPMNFLVFNNQ